jgi:hypothetical protein
MEAVTDEILAEAGWSWQEPVVELVVDQTVIASSTGVYVLEPEDGN